MILYSTNRVSLKYVNIKSFKDSLEIYLSYCSSLEKLGSIKSQSTQLAHLVNRYRAYVCAVASAISDSL